MIVKKNMQNENTPLMGEFGVKRMVLIIVVAIAISMVANWLEKKPVDNVQETAVVTHTPSIANPAIDLPVPDNVQNVATNNTEAPESGKAELAAITTPTSPPVHIRGAGNSVSTPYLNNTYGDGRTMNPYALQEYFGTQNMAAPDPDAQKTYSEGHSKLKESMQQFKH